MPETASPLSGWLTMRETARLLGIAYGTLRNRRSDERDRIPSQRIGHAVLYRLEDVQAHLRSAR